MTVLVFPLTPLRRRDRERQWGCLHRPGDGHRTPQQALSAVLMSAWPTEACGSSETLLIYFCFKPSRRQEEAKS